jgi:preprotein translocase SecE subunit
VAQAAEDEEQRQAEVEAGLREEDDDSPLAPMDGQAASDEDDIDASVSAAGDDAEPDSAPPDSAEGDSADGDAAEGDSADGDAAEGDAAEGDDDWDDDEDWDDEDDEAAVQLGHRRYVIAGFFGLWIICAYILGKALEMAWSIFASKEWFIRSLPQLAAVPYEGELVSRASLSLVLGAVIAGAVVYRYFVKPDIRQWADEVAEELSHVKWPNRKEVGNHTVVCIAATAVLTFYLTVLDRLWSFISDIVYKFGT